MAIKKFKESDEDEQVRKTALREVRILKVRLPPSAAALAASVPSASAGARARASRSNSSTTTSST